MIRGIHHVALHTANFDRMHRFYEEAFGFTPVADEIRWSDNAEVDALMGLEGSQARTVMLSAGTCYHELFEFAAPAPGARGR
jgi:glyoxylase I family protein